MTYLHCNDDAESYDGAYRAFVLEQQDKQSRQK